MKRERIQVSIVAAAAMALAMALTAEAAVQIDFDDNDAGIDTQPGFSSITTAGGAVPAAFGAGGTIGLSFASDGPVDDRNRGPMHPSQTLGDVGRDFIFGNRGSGATRLDVGVSDLAGGVYGFTGYFHDNNGSSAFDIDVDVDTGAGFTDGTVVSRSFGTNPAGGIATGSFDFTATGQDDVTFRLVAATNGHLINGLALTPKPGSVLNVDIGANGHDVQPGYFTFERSTSAGSDDESQTYLSTHGKDGTVDVTLANANVFRDRASSGNPVSGPLGDLAESFFAHQDQPTLMLSDLSAGNYLIRTFHHDSQTDHELLGVRVTDAVGTLVDQGLDIDPSFGTSPSLVTSATVGFAADGQSDVVLQFYEKTAGGSIVLNGFTLVAVPEPASAGLLGLAGVCLLRRRKKA